MNDLVRSLQKDLLNGYNISKREFGYNATRFLEMISKKGALETAKTLIKKDALSTGFIMLYENNRLDISLEAIVLKPEYKELFTENELNICRERLKSCGYDKFVK